MHRFKIFTFYLLFLSGFYALEGKTSIENDSKVGYFLSVDGKRFNVKGAASEGDHLRILKDFGGNTIRTWAIDEKTLDAAHKMGLKVVAGIWLEHMRHDVDYDYNDDEFINKQREKVVSLVKKFKDHPALLAWGLGNEVELHVPNDMLKTIWSEVNTIAELVKSVDPNHPIVTSVAGFNQQKINYIKQYYPLCEILGVNGYGFAHKVGKLLLEYGWEKPYMITEFGPLGTWEVGDKTDWGVVIEESSHEKAERYLRAYNAAMNESPNYCLGVFPFFWSNKQETTSTWYGMFLKNGARTEAVDAMAYAWNGEYPDNRVPEIHSISSSAKFKEVKRWSTHTADIQVIDHEDDPLEYTWVIMDESKVKSVGGDFEPTPKSYPKLILENNGNKVKFKTPWRKGPYRLFAYVEDDNRGAATVNFPFYVK